MGMPFVCRKEGVLASNLKKIIHFYRVHGFTVQTIHADPEFKALGDLLHAALDTVR